MASPKDTKDDRVSFFLDPKASPKYTQANPNPKLPRASPLSGRASTRNEFSQEIFDAGRIKATLGVEVSGHFVGPIPPEWFLHALLPDRPGRPAPPDGPPNPFSRVEQAADGTREKPMYTPFIDSVSQLTPSLRAINTSGTVDQMCGLKPDISFYPRTAVTRGTTDFTEIDLFVEFKASPSGDPFADEGDGLKAYPFEKRPTTVLRGGMSGPSSIDPACPMVSRGQLASYAGAILQLQFRTHLFSLAIYGDRARLFRWDACGVMVTASFEYASTDYLADFLWRFDGLTAAARGRDATVARISSSSQLRTDFGNPSQHTLDKLTEQDKDYVSCSNVSELQTIRRHRYFCTMDIPVPDATAAPSESMPTKRTFVISYPPRYCPQTPPSPFGRGVRFMYAYDVQEKRVVTMKQYWRALSVGASLPKEDAIYKDLHTRNVPHLPQVGIAGDIENVTPDDIYTTTTTRTQDMVYGGPGYEAWPTHKFNGLQLYRIVLDEVLVPLVEFNSPREMLSAVRDAAVCHDEAAFSASTILHRDINPGSIMMRQDTREGVLVDWDLSSQSTSLPVIRRANRQYLRDGVYQFRSSRLLALPDKPHTLVDDRESFLYVIAWVLLRYTTNNLDATDLCRMLNKFETYAPTLQNGATEPDKGVTYEGPSDLKKLWLAESDFATAVAFDAETAQAIAHLVTSLQTAFYSRYVTGPQATNPSIIAHRAFISRRGWLVDMLSDLLDNTDWPPDDEEPAASRNSSFGDAVVSSKHARLEAMMDRRVRSSIEPIAYDPAVAQAAAERRTVKQQQEAATDLEDPFGPF